MDNIEGLFAGIDKLPELSNREKRDLRDMLDGVPELTAQGLHDYLVPRRAQDQFLESVLEALERREEVETQRADLAKQRETHGAQVAELKKQREALEAEQAEVASQRQVYEAQTNELAALRTQNAALSTQLQHIRSDARAAARALPGGKLEFELVRDGAGLTRAIHAAGFAFELHRDGANVIRKIVTRPLDEQQGTAH